MRSHYLLQGIRAREGTQRRTKQGIRACIPFCAAIIPLSLKREGTQQRTKREEKGIQGVFLQGIKTRVQQTIMPYFLLFFFACLLCFFVCFCVTNRLDLVNNTVLVFVAYLFQENIKKNSLLKQQATTNKEYKTKF